MQKLFSLLSSTETKLPVSQSLGKMLLTWHQGEGTLVFPALEMGPDHLPPEAIVGPCAWPKMDMVSQCATVCWERMHHVFLLESPSILANHSLFLGEQEVSTDSQQLEHKDTHSESGSIAKFDTKSARRFLHLAVFLSTRQRFAKAWTFASLKNLVQKNKGIDASTEWCFFAFLQICPCWQCCQTESCACTTNSEKGKHCLALSFSLLRDR